MSQRRGGIFGYVFLAFLGLCFFLAGIAAHTLWLFSMVPASPGVQSRIVDIPQGLSGLEISRLLKEEGVIEDERLFFLLCRVRQVSQRLQAGEYEFSGLVTPNQIIDQMITGKVYVKRVTLPEGVTVRDIAGIFHRKGLASQDEFLRLARNEEVIQSLGIDAPSLEGYLFPETYFFRRHMSELSLIQSMVRQFWQSLPSHWEERAGELGLSLHDVVILASMVEKEAAAAEERPLVAAVFHNRLRIGMPLQSDPTAVYDLEDFSGPVRPEHLRRPSPYNTYLNRGLPAGPICNPGKSSILAVLHPEDVNYLYFVSNNDGTHHFSRTFQEHSQAVARYRLLRAQERERGTLQEEGDQ